jgi:2-C-methyl-D-erythritol 4-phosphate cytidylyltransferase
LKQIFGLVPAAGVGMRMGADRPKQYLRLGAQTLLERSVCCLLADRRVAGVLVVVAADDALAAALALPPRCALVAEGGATRAQTVRNGLRALRAGRGGLGAAGDADGVLVHDAARPCLEAADLAALIDAGGADAQGALLAVPVSDTLKAAQDGRVARTVDRAGLWRALTPQFFRVGVLAQALELAAQQPDVTDESAAVERAGLRPRLVEGRPGNIKVTMPGDLVLAEAILRQAGMWQARPA